MQRRCEMKNWILTAGILWLLPFPAFATNVYECPIGSCCDAGIAVSCGDMYCPRTKMTCAEKLACPTGRTCVNGQITAGCAAGTYLKNPADVACTPCEVGHKCPGGEKLGCEGLYEYQDEAGKAECKSCPGNQIAKTGKTACSAGIQSAPVSLHTGNHTLHPGVYSFEISGGGGGSGSTTCSNCGKNLYGSSQPGGRAERKTFPLYIVTDTSVTVSVGLGGSGGKDGQNGDVGCSYNCTVPQACNKGQDGGSTTVTLGANTTPLHSVAGGTGGQGKTWLIEQNGGTGFADLRAAEDAPACKVDEIYCGSAGGAAIIQNKPNSQKHEYWSDGNTGAVGYVRYTKLEPEN